MCRAGLSVKLSHDVSARLCYYYRHYDVLYEWEFNAEVVIGARRIFEKNGKKIIRNVIVKKNYGVYNSFNKYQKGEISWLNQE